MADDAATPTPVPPTPAPPPTYLDADGQYIGPEPWPGLKRNPISGRVLVLGGYSFFVPAMLLHDLSKTAAEGLLKKIEKVTVDGEDSAPVVEGIAAAVTILERSLRRNYPEITRDQIEELLDLANMNQMVEAVFTANGLQLNRPPWMPVAAPPAPATPTREATVAEIQEPLVKATTA